MPTRRDLLGHAPPSAAASALPSGGILGISDARSRTLRILILGGHGFIGPHQVHSALQRGHEVTLFNRGKRPPAWPGVVEELSGDRNSGNLEALEGREWDVCIDNPTTLPSWVRDAGKALRGRVRHYIFISTIAAYADIGRPGADESAARVPYVGNDPMRETPATLKADMRLYGPLKALSENEAQAQFPGITTIVRPGLIVGPGDDTDRFTYWPVRFARGGDMLAPGDGNDPVQFIDVRDLAEWTIRLAEQRTFGVFHATGPARELTMAGLLRAIGAAIRTRATPIWVPADFLDAQKVVPWSDMPVWLPGHGDNAGFTRLDLRKAIGAGLTYRPLAQTAADTLAWFEQQPAERQATLHAGLSAEREAAVLAAWKAKQAPA